MKPFLVLLTLVALGCGPKPRPASPAPSAVDAYIQTWKDSQQADPSWRAGR